MRHDDLRAQAESNRTSIVPIVPNRGLIVDRNGVVLASNLLAYTLEITPSKTLAGWGGHRRRTPAKVLDITTRDRRRFKQLEESKSLNHAHPHPPDRYRGGALLRPNGFAFSGGGDQAPPVSATTPMASWLAT